LAIKKYKKLQKLHRTQLKKITLLIMPLEAPG